MQRVPATETQGRIHTSACTVAVLAEPDEAQAVQINPADLRIDTYRASGAGGQHINKTDSAVRITHIPTGIVAECQDDRSQHRNKAKALQVLSARIQEKERSERAAKDAALRKGLIGSGDRSDRIRTYNFPQGRLTDHRINLTLYKLAAIMEGDLGDVLAALQRGARGRAAGRTGSSAAGMSDRHGAAHRRLRRKRPAPARRARQRPRTARLDAQLLLLHALGRPPHDRAWLLAHDTDALPARRGAALRGAVAAPRAPASRSPTCVGRQGILTASALQVDARVLVPRPDTETLVDWALRGAGRAARAARARPGHRQRRDRAGHRSTRGPTRGSMRVDASADALAVARANAAAPGPGGRASRRPTGSTAPRPATT